jgi:hypothetical protein
MEEMRWFRFSNSGGRRLGVSSAAADRHQLTNLNG